MKEMTPEEREAAKYEALVEITRSGDDYKADAERAQLKLDVYKEVYREIFDALLREIRPECAYE